MYTPSSISLSACRFQKGAHGSMRNDQQRQRQNHCSISSPLGIYSVGHQRVTVFQGLQKKCLASEVDSQYGFLKNGNNNINEGSESGSEPLHSPSILSDTVFICQSKEHKPMPLVSLPCPCLLFQEDTVLWFDWHFRFTF